MSTPQGTRPPTGATPSTGRPARQPSAGPSAATLRVRRIMALVLLAVIVVGLVMLVKAAVAFGTGLLADDPDGKVSPPKPQEVAAGGYRDCLAKDLALTLESPRTAYAVGEKPSFTVTLTHVGRRPCLVDSSGSVREITISSGTDRVWSSADCPLDSRDLLMAPGDVYPETVTWERVRSVPGCAGGLPEPEAGQYSAVATSTEVTGLTSAPLTFTLVGPPPPVEPPPATDVPADGVDEAPVEGETPTEDGAVPPEAPADGEPAG